MSALSRQSRPQKLLQSGWKEIMHSLHLAGTGVADSRADVVLLMYEVWKFITPHTITEHTAALGAPLIFLSPLVPSLFHSCC